MIKSTNLKLLTPTSKLLELNSNKRNYNGKNAKIKSTKLKTNSRIKMPVAKKLWNKNLKIWKTNNLKDISLWLKKKKSSDKSLNSKNWSPFLDHWINSKLNSRPLDLKKMPLVKKWTNNGPNSTPSTLKSNLIKKSSTNSNKLKEKIPKLPTILKAKSMKSKLPPTLKLMN